MTKYSGKSLTIHWLTGGGTVDLTGDSRVLDIDEQGNEIDVTTRSDAQAGAKDYLTDVPDRKWSVESLDTSGTVQAWDQLEVGDSGTLVYYPEGNSSGKRKRSATGKVMSKNFNSPYNNAPQIKLGGSLTSAIGKTNVS